MIGIIGGTSLGQALGALGGKPTHVDTPFGNPSSPVTLAQVGGINVALIARHGVGHTTPPSMVNYRANIWALKALGAKVVLASTAVGSLREEIKPGELCIPDQVIDKTHKRASTFFDELAVHVELASPFCTTMRTRLLENAKAVDTKVHTAGTYVCMEGPAFSTRAESELHRAWGAHLIGMTAMPEAKLAREASLCYATVSLPTDYDCWREPEHSVSRPQLLQEILKNLGLGTTRALTLLKATLPAAKAHSEQDCDCRHALDHAVFTDRAALPPAVKTKLALLIG
jgi:5'-methylthioadenosine phosphorylase